MIETFLERRRKRRDVSNNRDMLDHVGRKLMERRECLNDAPRVVEFREHSKRLVLNVSIVRTVDITTSYL